MRLSALPCCCCTEHARRAVQLAARHCYGTIPWFGTWPVFVSWRCEVSLSHLNLMPAIMRGMLNSMPAAACGNMSGRNVLLTSSNCRI
jgi:hypothetical protein